MWKPHLASTLIIIYIDKCLFRIFFLSVVYNAATSCILSTFLRLLTMALSSSLL